MTQTGAGISTSAGIPDFRSPDTGIYANLARLDLPHPEAVFDISYFRRNPHPFYSLSRELMPGRFRPTLAHSFIKLLYDRGRLLKLFTQNIDCLEREAGVPPEMIVEAHGSFASQSCIDCKASYPTDKMRQAIEAGDVPRCADCDGFVKPNVVFFGEALPESFFLNRTLPAAADLCIIMGTSLTVQPFASLPGMCSRETPRLLLNLHRAGGVGSRPDDVLLLGECDDGVRKLADALGWREELEALWAQTAPEGAEQPSKEEQREKEEETPHDRDERLRDEVEQLTKDVDQTLHVSQDHDQKVRDQLQNQTHVEQQGKASPESQPGAQAQDQDQDNDNDNAASTDKASKPTEERDTNTTSSEGQEGQVADKPTGSSDDRQPKKPPSAL